MTSITNDSQIIINERTSTQNEADQILYKNLTLCIKYLLMTIESSMKFQTIHDINTIRSSFTYFHTLFIRTMESQTNLLISQRNHYHDIVYDNTHRQPSQSINDNEPSSHGGNLPKTLSVTNTVRFDSSTKNVEKLSHQLELKLIDRLISMTISLLLFHENFLNKISKLLQIDYQSDFSNHSVKTEKEKFFVPSFLRTPTPDDDRLNFAYHKLLEKRNSLLQSFTPATINTNEEIIYLNEECLSNSIQLRNRLETSGYRINKEFNETAQEFSERIAKFSGISDDSIRYQLNNRSHMNRKDEQIHEKENWQTRLICLNFLRCFKYPSRQYKKIFCLIFLVLLIVIILFSIIIGIKQST
ncbi:hypothetical protein SNEBB_007096 [Seison nebaliae]|nr:hypothetical protein SNEBB_007096 [Seison nebaliae]